MKLVPAEKKNVIIVKVIGGLGNQMFQYAAGRALAETLGAKLFLDLHAYATYKVHAFSLDTFNVAYETFGVLPFRLSPSIYRTLGRNVLLEKARRFAIRRMLPIYIEKKETYDPSFVDLKAPVYLEGYFQSPKYFSNIEEILRKEFAIKVPPSEANRELAQKIELCEAVSLHVRRGDYVSNPAAAQVHGVLSLDYYRRATDVIRERVKDPRLFIFSDDPEWVSSNMNFDMPTTYIRGNDGARNYEDLRLMSLCKHHITANSTFSWWGAWLGKNPQKTVVRPKDWYHNKNLDVSDFIPSSWIQV